MRRWRGWLALCVVLGFSGLVAPGCSSGGSGSGNGGGSCQSSSDCTEWRCTCNDGTSMSMGECIMNKCGTASDVCGSQCKNNGGLKSATPVPTVKDSSECKAFCNKATSLCSGYTCDRSFWCSVPEGECAAQVKAELQCQVDKGTWSCNSGGFAVTGGSCFFSNLCAEAGTGGAGGGGPVDAGTE